MSSLPRLWLAVFVFALITPPARSQTTTFTGVGILPGGLGSSVSALSADGRTATGYARTTGTDSHLFRWTAAGGMQDLGNLPGGTFVNVGGISADGQTIVGDGDRTGPFGVPTGRGFRWTAAGGMQELDPPSGGFSTAAFAVSADGRAIAGQVFTSSAQRRAYLWTEGGSVNLGTLPGHTESVAWGMSGDGRVVVGGSGSRAFRWTAADGMQDLGVLPGMIRSWANGVSGDGRIVIGASETNTERRAFRWTAGRGMESLGVLPGGNSSNAWAASSDGGIVVGLSASSSGNRAVVWDAAGIQDLNVVLTAQGVDLTGWTLTSATSVVGDQSAGYTIAGSGLHDGIVEGFVVSGVQLTPVPEPTVILGLAAAGLGVTRLIRRRLRRTDD
jgi:probable HAF family extracellular repeat protein